MDIKLILYYFFIAAGALFSAVTGYRLGIKRGFLPRTLKLYISVAIFSGIFSALLMGQLQNFIMSLTGLEFYPSRLRIFGALLFNPVLIYFPVKQLAGDYDEVLDIFSAGTYGMSGISKIGCAVYGCCYGTACTPGVYTPFEEHSVFPVQLLEAVLSLIICFGVFYAVSKKKHRKGAVYPLSLILYGVMRFFVEFLRYYSEEELNAFYGLSFWQWVSIITVLIGAVWLTYKLHRKSRGLQKSERQCEE